MLEHLFGSKTRVKLLQVFLNNPDQPLYLRELARRLKVQLNAVRREVNNLVRLEILKWVAEPGGAALTKKAKRRHGMRRYLTANTDFILYPDLRALLLKAQLLVERSLVDKIIRLPRLQLFLLSGIFVGRSDAPTDVLLVGAVNHERLAKIIRSAERQLHHPINYTVLALPEYRYRMEITDRFLYQILEGQKIVIFDKTRSPLQNSRLPAS